MDGARDDVNPFKEYIALCFCLVLFDRYI